MVGSPRRRNVQPRASRSHRGAWAAVCVVAVLAVAAFTARGSTDSGAPRATVPSNGGMTCQAQPTREPCEAVEISGRVWRYAYLPAAKPTADTVVVDFGGPGLAVLSGEARIGDFRAAYPTLASRYNLVIPEEPWVTQVIRPECEDAMTRYYLAARSMRAEVASAGREVSDACGLGGSSQEWGFTPSSYTRLIQAISSRHSLVIKGFVGQSWGSVRLSYLGSARIDWAVLLRPYPLGVSADALVEERSRLLDKLAAPVQRMNAVRTSDRSVEISQFDQFSAVVGLGYVDDESVPALLPGIRNGTALGEIGRLSDMLWMRYGTDSISPGRLAQIQEQCSVIGPTSGSLAPGTADVRWVIAAQLAPCGSLPRTPTNPWPTSRVCVVSSPLDTVTPDALVHQAYGTTSSGIERVQSAKRSHSSFDGLETCLERVAR
jgi:hypothetical protein